MIRGEPIHTLTEMVLPAEQLTPPSQTSQRLILHGACFYIQNEARVHGKDEIDLAVDPPPDLVIEIDITSPSLNKFPIYARIGVPEVWRYDGRQMQMFALATGEYVHIEQSTVFPRLSSALATHFLEESTKLRSTTWLRRVREWARAQRKTSRRTKKRTAH